MLLTIHWVAELGLWKVSDSRRERIVLPEDINPGGKLAGAAQAFQDARQAVESDRAVMGVNVEV